MGLTVTHRFVSVKPDNPDATLVNPSNWNDVHVITSNTVIKVSLDYDFTPIQPGGTLTAGITNTITLPVVPLGVNGTDTKHYLYISGGTGTAETVLITGGTAVAQGINQTLTFVPANNHSGAWTIQSASRGITEAAFDLPVGISTPRAALGIVYIPSGSFIVRAAIPVMQGCSFWGSGRYSTKLVPPTSSSIIFDTNLPVHAASELNITRDEISFYDFAIDGTAFNSANTIYGIRGFVASTVPLWGTVGCIIQRVNFINCTKGIVLQRSQGVSILDCSAFGFTTFDFTTNAPTTDNPFNSYEILIDNFRYYNYGPDANLVFANAFGNVNIINAVNVEVLTITNSIFRMAGGTLGAAPCCIGVGGASERIVIDNVVAENPVLSLDFYPVTNNGTTFHPGYFSVNKMAIDQMWGPGIRTSIGSSLAVFQQTHNGTISDCELTNPRIEAVTVASGINLQPYSKNISIDNCKFTNFLPGGTAQPALVIGDNADNITVDPSNKFVSDSSAFTGGSSTGILVLSTATRVRVPRLVDSIFYDVPLNDPGATVASAATITLPYFREDIYITGTTTITAITAPSALFKGYRFTLFFGASISVTKGGSLHMSSNFGPTVTDGSLTLEWNGTAFLEVSRCVN